MAFGEVARVLWRRKLVALLVITLVVGGAAYFVSTQEKVYESKASVFFLPDSRNPVNVSLYTQIIDNLLPTYAQLVKSRSFLDDVARDLPYPATGGRLGGKVFAQPVSGAGVLKLVGHSGEARKAADLARVASRTLADRLKNSGVFDIRIFDTARVPGSPIAPRPKLVLFASAVMALFLGAGASIAWDRLFGRIHESRELADVSGLPVVGVLPEERALRSGRRIFVGDPSMARLDESLRAIRTNLMFAIGASELRSVMISGLNPQDGKSTVAANLAVAIAELGFQVVLVDGDVHRPSQHELFGLPNARGLTSTVLAGADPASLVQQTRYPGVRVVTAGPPLVSRSQEVDVYLQYLPRFGRLADIVLVDSPPLRAADDVRLLAASAGGVLLLVRAGTASPRQVKAAVESLRVLEARVLGAVLMRATEGVAMGDSVGYYTYRRAEAEQR